MTTHQEQMQKQAKVIELLEAYGVTFQQSIGSGSEEKYTKSNGSGQVMLITSGDVDFGGVFEEEKVEGVVITSGWADSGIGTQRYPIYRVTFN